MGYVALCSVRLLKTRTVWCGNDSRLFNSFAHYMPLSPVEICFTNILSAHHPRFRLKPSHLVLQTVNIFCFVYTTYVLAARLPPSNRNPIVNFRGTSLWKLGQTRQMYGFKKKRRHKIFWRNIGIKCNAILYFFVWFLGKKSPLTKTLFRK